MRDTWDVKDYWTVSLDYTQGGEPEVSFLEPGVIKTALYPYVDDELPIGELLLSVNGVVVAIVAEPTGRETYPEVTAVMVDAAETNREYGGSLSRWLHTLKAGEA